MANEIQTKTDTKANFTINIQSVADGAAVQSDMIDNDDSASERRGAALLYFRVRSGAVAPDAGAIYEFYLLRGDAETPTYRTDNAGASAAAITIENATLVGTIVVTASTNKDFYGDFDTAPLGPLGPEWGVAFKNESGQTTNSTAGNHIKEYSRYLPEIQ